MYPAYSRLGIFLEDQSALSDTFRREVRRLALQIAVEAYSKGRKDASDTPAYWRIVPRIGSPKHDAFPHRYLTRAEAASALMNLSADWVVRGFDSAGNPFDSAAQSQ